MILTVGSANFWQNGPSTNKACYYHSRNLRDRRAYLMNLATFIKQMWAVTFLYPFWAFLWLISLNLWVQLVSSFPTDPWLTSGSHEMKQMRGRDFDAFCRVSQYAHQWLRTWYDIGKITINSKSFPVTHFSKIANDQSLINSNILILIVRFFCESARQSLFRILSTLSHKITQNHMTLDVYGMCLPYVASKLDMLDYYYFFLSTTYIPKYTNTVQSCKWSI